MDSASLVVLDILKRSDPVFHGIGLAIALCMLLALIVLLPKQQKKRLRGPLWLLVAHMASAALLLVMPTRYGEHRLVELVAAFFLLACLGRSAFLLLVDSFWARRSTQPVPQILRDVLQAATYALIGMLVLRAAGVEPGSLLATSALLTAVIGLSLQETLGNLFAGLAIQAQRPFDVGDWIQFEENVGKVLEINWRATHVLTVEDVVVIVPNGALAKVPIYNFARPSHITRRSVHVTTSYQASPEFVRRILLEGIADTQDMLERPAPSVVTKEFNESGIQYEVRFYIRDYALREMVDSDVRERVWYALERNGLKLTFPRRRLEFEPLLPQRAPGEADPEATKLVAESELFKMLVPEDAKHLVAACQQRLYASEERIIRRGDRGTEMYLIERGAVRIVAKTTSGRARKVTDLGRGEFFGEMSLMTGEARAADVVTIEETLVLVIEREALAPILERNPELANHISRVLAERQQWLAEIEGDTQEPQSAQHEQELLGRIKNFFNL